MLRSATRIGMPALAVLLTITACGGAATAGRGSTPSPSPTAAVSTPAAAAGTTPGATPSTPGATASTPAPAGTQAAQCTDADLSVTVGAWVGAGGHGGVPLVFTNRSTANCTVTGYPGAAILNASGRQVQQATRRPTGYLGGLQPGTTSPPVVTLGPSQTAAARLEWIENPQAPRQTTCPSYGAILVTPPNTYRSTELRPQRPIELCASLAIHPVLSGTTGAWS